MRQHLVAVRFLVACGLAGSLALLLSSHKADYSRPSIYKSASEYDPVQTVILSEILFEDPFPGSDILAAILEAGATVTILGNAPQADKPQSPTVQEQIKKWVDAKDVDFMYVAHDTQWIRDFGPFPVYKRVTGDHRVGLQFLDFGYDVEEPLNDMVPYQIAMQKKLSVENIPFTFDGGNFQKDGDTCFFTSVPEEQDRMRNTQAQLFYRWLGCKRSVALSENIHPHIDMWLKVMAPGVVVINQIPDYAFDHYRDLKLPQSEELLQLQQDLDGAASIVEQHATVIRIPMPIPFDGVFRTYTNSLLVNGTAIVPSYIRQDASQDQKWPDQSIIEGMEKEVSDLYQELGYKPRFVDSSLLIQLGGAIHCVTLQVPKPGLERESLSYK